MGKHGHGKDKAKAAAQDPVFRKLKFDQAMTEYVQLCSQLGELEYHYEKVIPRRRGEILAEMDRVQKEANKWNPATQTGSVPPSKEPSVEPTADPTSPEAPAATPEDSPEAPAAPDATSDES